MEKEPQIQEIASKIVDSTKAGNSLTKHFQIFGFIVITLIFLLLLTLSIFIWVHTARISRRVRKLTDSASMSSYINAAAKGFTQGLGNTIASSIKTTAGNSINRDL
jgi:hypothetical protein